MPAGQILFALPKKYSKTLVQKNAIAEHRSFSLQNAFSIAIFSHSFKLCKCWAIDALLQLHSLLLFFEQTAPKQYLTK